MPVLALAAVEAGPDINSSCLEECGLVSSMTPLATAAIIFRVAIPRLGGWPIES